MDRTPFDPPYIPEAAPKPEDLHYDLRIDKVPSIEEQLILKLYERFGRFPTEEELFQFVFGDDWTQFVIWNKEKAGYKCTTATQET